MRYIVFPSFESKDEIRPQLDDLIEDSDVDILSGPSEMGLYLIEGLTSSIEVVKFIVYPYYVIMEDFDPPTIH